MMRDLRGSVRRFVHGLRTEGAGPRREVAAIAVGTFIGCLPLYGLHLLLCVAAGTILHLNRLKMYLAANISNPFVAPWLLFAEVQTGAFIRRGAFHEISFDAVQSTPLSVYAIDVAAGSVAVGGLLAALAAWGTHLVVRRDRDGDRFFDIAQRAADRYVGTSLTAWEFARGKVRFDPIYKALLADGLLAPGRGASQPRTLLDVGCGQGLMLALLSEARGDIQSGRWPADWPDVRFDRLVGIEKRPHVAALAAAALGGDAEVTAADARALEARSADVVLFLDVLHMMARDEQESVLGSACASLSPGGRIVIREANAGVGWRFAMVAISNRLKAFLFGEWRQRFAFRSAADWQACFTRLGMCSEMRDMGEGTPFANVLFVLSPAEAAMPNTRRTDTRTQGVS